MFRISELRAVNIILGAAGEDPITTLADLNPMSEAQLIRNEIEVAIWDISTQGWTWNMNPRVTLRQDVDGRVPIGSNVLSIQRVYAANLVVRGSHIWDSKGNTDVINSDVDVAATLLLPFDELPYVAQSAVLLRAGRNYLTNFDTANDERWTAARESEAMDALTQEDVDVGGLGYTYTQIGRDIAYRPNQRARYF